jgi:hypothetical protein
VEPGLDLARDVEQPGAVGADARDRLLDDPCQGGLDAG